jgi:hypothetical protein
MGKRLPALLAFAAATILPGCGDAKREVDVEQIRSVVNQFAGSDDAHACDLLSPNALVDVYGGFRKPVEVAKATCVRRSVKFKGEPVRITHLDVVDASYARVTALNTAGDVTYDLALRRFGPAWRIDTITQAKAEQ